MVRWSELYRRHFPPPRERHFLAALAFLLTFAAVRGITHAIRAQVGPFHDVVPGGVHIHHLVWGVLLLLLVGYLWLLGIGGGDDGRLWLSRLTALLFGVGAALTLDEFAIWLFLDPNVYWERRGRDSVDAVVLFGGLLWLGVVAGPFLGGAWRRLRRLSQSGSPRC